MGSHFASYLPPKPPPISVTVRRTFSMGTWKVLAISPRLLKGDWAGTQTWISPEMGSAWAVAVWVSMVVCCSIPQVKSLSTISSAWAKPASTSPFFRWYWSPMLVPWTGKQALEQSYWLQSSWTSTSFFMEVSRSLTTGSCSYSTRISPAASRAISWVSAATAATGSPW